MDTFSIHWEYSVKPPKSFVIWGNKRGIVRFAFTVEINNNPIPSIEGDFAISVSDLCASVQEDGRYCIFTCSVCGEAGCAGNLPVEVVHIDGSTFWNDPSYLQNSYEFDTSTYQESIHKLAQEVEKLRRQYPDYDFDPVLW